MADEARVTQAPVEVVSTTPAPEARATAAPVETVIAADNDARATQAYIEPVVSEPGTARVTQAYIEVVSEYESPTPPLDIPGTVYSSVDLPDPSTYYLGFKDGRVLSFGTATRTLSDLKGQWSANDISVTLADTDRSVRRVLQLAKGLRETQALVRMISDADRRLQLTPTVVFRGALRAWKPRGDLAVELEYTDAVGLKLARRGNDREVPTRQVTQADFPEAPAKQQAAPIPIIYGVHELYDGACPLVYVGPLDIGLGKMHTWVVAGHACVEVDLFLDGVMIHDAPPLGTTWFVPPGQGEPPSPGWTLPTTYVDINGRRYTVVQGTGADPDAVAAGSKTLTANVYGIESTGDGTGLLLTQSFLQYLHFFKQFVLRDYESGVWFSDPIEWEPGWCQINEQSFIAAQAESRRWVEGDGYIGQAYIGPERRAVRDWLATWNTSLNCRLGLNRYHQWIVSMLPGALSADALAALPRLSDAQDILQNSFDLTGLDEEAITRATVSAYKRPSDSSVYGSTERFVDRQAEEDSGVEIGATLLLDFLASTPQLESPLPTTLMASATDVAKRWIGTRSGPPIYRVSFDAGLCAYEAIDVGDLFRVTHFAGTTVEGWTNRIVWCESVALDIDRRVVTFTGLDVTHVYEGERTLESIVDPQPGEGSPETPPPPPPIEGESPAAPTGFSGALVDAAEGSAYYGTASTTVYYKLVAVFDNGEESKPAFAGPFTTDSDGGSTLRKRVHLAWNVYPTGTQTGRGGATVTPVAMRLYRAADDTFLNSVQQMDREQYPIPEQPGNFRCTSKSGSGTTYYYWVRSYYYLSGVSEDMTDITVDSGATADVWLDWIEDPAVDQVGRLGVFEQQVFGRTASGGPGHAGRYLSVGLFGSYHDDGRDTEKGGGGIEPFTPPPTGNDIPLSGTTFYDQWPGKQDTTDNPWVTL